MKIKLNGNITGLDTAKEKINEFKYISSRNHSKWNMARKKMGKKWTKHKWAVGQLQQPNIQGNCSPWRKVEGRINIWENNGWKKFSNLMKTINPQTQKGQQP